MCVINHLEVIISLRGQEFVVKPEVAKLSKFLCSQLDHAQIKVLELDSVLISAESTNSLGERKVISCEEVAMVFALLDKIYTIFTPRSDGGYVAQQVQLDVDYAFISYDNQFLGNVCRISYVLGIPFLVNACASTIMARPGIVDWIIDLENMDDEYITADYDLIGRQLFESDFGWFAHDILKLLKKHFLIKKGKIV